MSRVRMPWWDIDETIALEHRLIDSTNGSIVSNGVSDPIAVISKSINGKDPDNNNKEFSTTTTSVDGKMMNYFEIPTIISMSPPPQT